MSDPVFARALHPPPHGEDEPDPWLIVAELLEAQAARITKLEEAVQTLAARQIVKSVVHERDPTTRQIVRSVITEAPVDS